MARIYVADDDADIRNLLTLSLQEEGHEVLGAENGEAALECILNEPPDLLILDVMMPLMDGFQVLKALDTYALRPAIKVLMLTARGAEADRIRGLQEGADRYLGKPFEPAELMATVQEILEASSEELRRNKEDDLEKARLLERLESVFEEPQAT
ncbi:MAG: two-component system, OmpR family, phosphate regulon response regulator PhoB [Actinomycetota bacterium]|jgi:two-component system response regulator CpxR|nr:two-component system, OmpR family, phosphate regulon response regulator PhoB [Actinomycetota bacterium]